MCIRDSTCPDITHIDLTGELIDLTGELIDLIGELIDLTGELIDLTGELIDLIGELIDLTGELNDLDIEVFDLVDRGLRPSHRGPLPLFLAVRPWRREGCGGDFVTQLWVLQRLALCMLTSAFSPEDSAHH